MITFILDSFCYQLFAEKSHLNTGKIMNIYESILAWKNENKVPTLSKLLAIILYIFTALYNKAILNPPNHVAV